MSLDGKLLAKARKLLEDKKRQREDEHERRVQEVYAKLPQVQELDANLRGTMIELFGAAITPDGQDKIPDIRRRNLMLQEQRVQELRRGGFPLEYLDDGYACADCNDTGHMKQGGICHCLMDLYKSEQTKSLSSLLKMGGETFANFNLNYYDSTPVGGVSPRQSMEIIYETAYQYAHRFGERSPNLFFNGQPGLGKTFLSACIARVVSESGFSVVYDTAGSIFAKFENAKFLRDEDKESAQSEVARCLACDLLILDDLGTEMTTAFTISALYELVNTRLITGKKTIVSSNLTPDELRRRYSEQIVSRLEGEDQVLTFRGDDIRKRVNN